MSQKRIDEAVSAVKFLEKELKTRLKGKSVNSDKYDFCMRFENKNADYAFINMSKTIHSIIEEKFPNAEVKAYRNEKVHEGCGCIVADSVYESWVITEKDDSSPIRLSGVITVVNDVNYKSGETYFMITA